MLLAAIKSPDSVGSKRAGGPAAATVYRRPERVSSNVLGSTAGETAIIERYMLPSC